MTSSVFPDINVWLALSFSRHKHHNIAQKWFVSLDKGTELLLCRFTQLGLLRLLTTSSVMGVSVATQRQAWSLYDELMQDRVRLMQEPAALGKSFRALANLNSASPKDWADSYLIAFALETDAILVTFDRALSSRAEGSVLLRPELM